MIYINDKHNATHEVTITLCDQAGLDPGDWACWAVFDGDDTRYVEITVGAELWEIIELAARAYEGEDSE